MSDEAGCVSFAQKMYGVKRRSNLDACIYSVSANKTPISLKLGNCVERKTKFSGLHIRLTCVQLNTRQGIYCSN